MCVCPRWWVKQRDILNYFWWCEERQNKVFNYFITCMDCFEELYETIKYYWHNIRHKYVEICTEHTKIKWLDCSALNMSLQVTVEAVSYLKDHKKTAWLCSLPPVSGLKSGKREEVTVILLPENLTTVNHVKTLTAQHTLSVASDSVSCVNMAKSFHHIDVIVYGLTNSGERVAMVDRILDACDVDCFFILSFLVLNFKLVFSMHFTTK